MKDQKRTSAEVAWCVRMLAPSALAAAVVTSAACQGPLIGALLHVDSDGTTTTKAVIPADGHDKGSGAFAVDAANGNDDAVFVLQRDTLRQFCLFSCWEYDEAIFTARLDDSGPAAELISAGESQIATFAALAARGDNAWAIGNGDTWRALDDGELEVSSERGAGFLVRGADGRLAAGGKSYEADDPLAFVSDEATGARGDAFARDVDQLVARPNGYVGLGDGDLVFFDVDGLVVASAPLDGDSSDGSVTERDMFGATSAGAWRVATYDSVTWVLERYDEAANKEVVPLPILEELGIEFATEEPPASVLAADTVDDETVVLIVSVRERRDEALLIDVDLATGAQRGQRAIGTPLVGINTLQTRQDVDGGRWLFVAGWAK